MAKKQDNVLGQAEDADPSDPFTQALRDRFNSLSHEREQLAHKLAELDREAGGAPRSVKPSDLELVEVLPHLALNLHRAPEELQSRLFDLTKLSVQIDYETDNAMIEITVPGDGACDLAETAKDIQLSEISTKQSNGSRKPQAKPGVIAAGAPGAIRTHTGRILSRQERVALGDLLGERDDGWWRCR